MVRTVLTCASPFGDGTVWSGVNTPAQDSDHAALQEDRPMKYHTLAVFAIVVATGAVPADAGIWQDVFQGLDYLATPTGYPVTTNVDGTRVNGARSGRVRIVPNGVVGNGYRIEFDRTFGGDSRGRSEVFRFGALGDLTLSGATQFTAGYDAVGKAYSGFANVIVSDMNYRVRTKLGVQDATLEGTLNLFGNLEVNALGFYDLTLSASNANSKFMLDGVVARDTQDTNFDVGPIVVHGNLLVDASAALLTSLGVDATSLEGLFPASGIDQIDNAIENLRQQAGAESGTPADKDMTALLLQSVLGGDGQAASTLVAGLADGTICGNGESAQTSPLMVPEPGTFALVALGTSTIWYWRRRAS